MNIILKEKNGDEINSVDKPERNENFDKVGDLTEKNEREITATTDSQNDGSDEVEKELRRQGITLNELVSDNPRLSLDWQPFRGITQCKCASPIDSLTRKVSLKLVN